MKIVRLTAENIKRLIAVEIEPSGQVVKISGRNGAGKTSVLDAMLWAFAGGKSIDKRPVRDGEASGRVVVDVGQYKIERNFVGKQTYLKVSTAEGHIVTSPQKVLDDLLGAMSFDPLAFSRMAEKEQYELLRQLIGLDTEALDVERATLYAERTDVNREHKTLSGYVASTGEDVRNAPDALQDLSVEQQAVMAARGALEDIRRASDRLDAQRSAAAAHREAARALEGRAKALREEADEAESQATKRRAEADEIIGRIPEIEALIAGSDAATQALQDAERAQTAAIEANSLVPQKQTFLAYTAKVAALDADSKAKTARIEEIDKEKATLISAATYPVEGLSVGDGVVLYNGFPLRQCSASEQLRVSCAIAMAANPKLRVIRITDGSLLDTASMQILADMAATDDYQVWVEIVDETGKVGVYIEDGCVVRDNDRTDTEQAPTPPEAA